jgi:hypothetical protein
MASATVRDFRADDERDDEKPRYGEGPLAVRAGVVANLLLRLTMLYFAYDALFNASDERYNGKNLGPRNLIICFGLALLFPALQYVWKKWEHYPVWFDNLYLSMFWMDMMGNYFNFFNKYEDFDMLPHFYGPGALAVVLAGAFGLPVLIAWGVTMALHALLELQEWIGDIFFHAHNVRGWWDSAHDLGAGLVGATLYLWMFSKWQTPKKHPPENDEE